MDFKNAIWFQNSDPSVVIRAQQQDPLTHLPHLIVLDVTRKNPLSEPVTSNENKITKLQPNEAIEALESDQRNEQNEEANVTQEEELPIPPELFVDHYADVKVKWCKMDDEPLLYRDK